MYELYYLPVANTFFSAVDATLYIKVTLDDEEHFLPFFALRHTIIGSGIYGTDVDERCILSRDTPQKKLFAKFVEEKHRMNTPLLRKLLPEYSNISLRIREHQEENIHLVRVTDIPKAFDDMARIFEGVEEYEQSYHEQEYMFYLQGRHRVRKFVLDSLRPYFPELFPEFPVAAPYIFL